ncbi:MAG TPA: PA14 domain-containing protein, partial [Planctomycetota bacterium]|nr:PA14 domain-containing protein [Planctomycetota bacterium]
MSRSVRHLMLVSLAIASLLFAARAAAWRAAARDALAKAGRENVDRMRELELARRQRLEAQADSILSATERSARRALESAAVPVVPIPGARRAPIPADLKPVDARDVRDRVRGIAGNIVPASSGGSEGRPAVSTLAPEPPTSTAEKKEDRKPGTGLRAEYWKFIDVELRRFPDVDRKVPTLVRVDPRIEFHEGGDFKLPFRCRNIAVRWRGFLYAERDGIYTFTLGSDDGAVLLLDGSTAIDNEGLHPYLERSADKYLAEGFHPIEVHFFQNEHQAAAVLSWVPAVGEPGPVPTSVLYPADRVRADQAPTISKV